MRPLLVGIAGGSGSGKTTTARRVAASLPEGSVAVIEHDAYYRDRSGMPQHERDLLNFDHPDALETELLADHLAALKEGKAVEVPIYDFAGHVRRKETRTVFPSPVIVLEGILIFADPRVRKILDLRVFVDTESDLRLLRRVRRDIAERGRSVEAVLEQYLRTVRPMHHQFVEGSKRYADIVVPECDDLDVPVAVIAEYLRAALPPEVRAVAAADAVGDVVR